MLNVSLACRSHIQLVSEVSRLIKPAAYLQRLADAVVAGLSKDGQQAFNGVHLRLEEDSPYVEMMGGLEASRSLRSTYQPIDTVTVIIGDAWHSVCVEWSAYRQDFCAPW